MGGLGSGLSTNRRTVESLLALDVRKLQRDGMLERDVRSYPSWSMRGKPYAQTKVLASTNSITVEYMLMKRTGMKQQISQQVMLTTTPCHYGHERIWFECPQCSQRIAIIYLSNSVACRKCLNLNYRCQRETDSDRTLRRLHKILDDLQASTYSIFAPTPRRPPGMKKNRYDQLIRDCAKTKQQALANLAAAVEGL